MYIKYISVCTCAVCARSACIYRCALSHMQVALRDEVRQLKQALDLREADAMLRDEDTARLKAENVALQRKVCRVLGVAGVYVERVNVL